MSKPKIKTWLGLGVLVPTDSHAGILVSKYCCLGSGLCTRFNYNKKPKKFRRREGKGWGGFSDITVNEFHIFEQIFAIIKNDCSSNGSMV